MKTLINKFRKKETWILFFNQAVFFIKRLPDYLKFFILLFIFLANQVSLILAKIPFLGFLLKPVFFHIGKWFNKIFVPLVYRLNVCHPDVKTRRMFLIDLSYRNLLMKKTRTLITIFGMSVGIGVIVLLISLGYGIERLVVNKVASLEEMQMVDVSAAENTSVKLDIKMYQRIKKIKNVKKAIPLVSLVGKIFYKKASTDVIVYSTPKDYFDYVRQRLIKGKYYSDNTSFEDKKISAINKEEGEVAGVFSQLKTKLKSFSPVDGSIIKFNVLPEEKVAVWQECTIKSQFLGYALRLEGGYTGVEHYGSSFYPFSENGLVGVDKNNNAFVGLWIKGKFPLFQNSTTPQGEILTPILDKEGQQLWVEGCIPQYKVKIEEKIQMKGEVLGEATGSATFNTSTSSASLDSGKEKQATDSAAFLDNLTVVASSEGGIEVVSLQATGSAKKKEEAVVFKDKASGEAVVSLGLLNLLNIPQDKAVNTEIGLSLVLVKNLIPNLDSKATTEEVSYKIIGIIDDDSSAFLYIPFSDLYKLAINNLSQIKLFLSSKNDLSKVRKEIETLGFKTSSVVDTVKQIESVFGNVRFVLGLIGLVALVVAALGMFNTLTVSLLERTREIGGMKVMGVVSYEIEDLFLAEAMIMGLAGGFGGLILGFLAGKLISIVVSLIAFSSQKAFLDLTYLPFSFILFIILLSFFVGLITGLYPAQRAKKISPLNALRYE